MKALSVRQPWASYIADGSKTVETRKWSTPWRGELLICASLSVDDAAARRTNLSAQEFMEKFPVGVALCVVRVADCVRMTAEHQRAARCAWYDGAWAWIMEGVRKVKPFPVRGSLGLFNVDGDLIEDASQGELIPENPPF